jgi:putative pyruvate formate lyase activating enzyme
MSPQDLAATMLSLEEQGCHNINLVSPSHVVAPVLAALAIAAEAGMRLPLVYNTGGYDSSETLALLDGVVDIYMPDMKYDDAQAGKAYSGVPDYPAVNRAALSEMHRQIGDLLCDRGGVALRGLLVRHLVLPNDLAGTRGIMRFLADEISSNTYLNIMDQYRPCYRAQAAPELDRKISPQEYQLALNAAREVGLTRLDSRSSRLVWLQPW